MNNLSKLAVLVAGLSVVAVVTPAAANDRCQSVYSTQYGPTEHRARQAAIIGVNTKFNRIKADSIRQFGNARNLNHQIEHNVIIRPIDLNCRYSNNNHSYKCRATKTWCVRR